MTFLFLELPAESGLPEAEGGDEGLQFGVVVYPFGGYLG